MCDVMKVCATTLVIGGLFLSIQSQVNPPFKFVCAAVLPTFPVNVYVHYIIPPSNY